MWWPWLLLAALLAGLIFFLVARSRRTAKWDASFEADLAESRWVADSLVPSVTNRSLPVEQSQQQWLDGKRRLDDLQSDLYRLGTSIPNPARATRLGTVSGALGALQESLEADVALRGTASGVPDGDTQLAASQQTVYHRRDALLAAIDDRPVGPSHAAG